MIAGDTRITVIEVSDLLPEQEIPKKTLLVKLEEEAPHFMYTLLNLQLPPTDRAAAAAGRGDPQQGRTVELNKTALQRFLEECCQAKKDARLLRFGEFFDGFQKWLDAGEKHLWSKIRVSREMPNRHRIVRGHAGERFIQDLVLQGAGGDGAMLIQVHQTMGYVTRSILQARPVAEVDVESCPKTPKTSPTSTAAITSKLHLETMTMSKYGMTDSGRRQSFGKGMAIRDTADDKPRPDLISPFAEERQGHWLRMGAAKYAERNWENGMPFSRCVASLKRHVMKYQQGKRDEDHLAAIMFNAMALIHYEEMIERGGLPAAERHAELRPTAKAC